MRSPKALVGDVALQNAVANELAWDPQVDDLRILVAVKNGSVALSGFVTSYPQKRAAVQAAERVDGVTTVADDIEVVLPRAVRRRDAEIAAEIARERRWHTAIPDSVIVEVGKGIVTLRGTVEWGYQRDEAARAVSHLEGVRGLVNLIQVDPGAGADVDEVERRIEDAIARMANLDARSIRVTASDGVVHLDGSVRSLSERRIVERAAESAPGVTRVQNDLVVGY